MKIVHVTKYLCYLGGKYLLKVFTCLEFSEDKMAVGILKIDLFPFTFPKKKVESTVKLFHFSNNS